MFYYSVLLFVGSLAMSMAMTYSLGMQDEYTQAWWFFTIVMAPIVIVANRKTVPAVNPEIDAAVANNMRVRMGNDTLVMQFEKNQIHIGHVHGGMTCGGFRLDVLPSDYWSSGWPASMRLYFPWQAEDVYGVRDGEDANASLFIGRDAQEMFLPDTSVQYLLPDAESKTHLLVKSAQLFPHAKLSEKALT